jgi:hypothetical protein
MVSRRRFKPLKKLGCPAIPLYHTPFFFFFWLKFWLKQHYLCRGNLCFIFVKIGNFNTSGREKLVRRVRIIGIQSAQSWLQAANSWLKCQDLADCLPTINLKLGYGRATVGYNTNLLAAIFTINAFLSLFIIRGWG